MKQLLIHLPTVCSPETANHLRKGNVTPFGISLLNDNVVKALWTTLRAVTPFTCPADLKDTPPEGRWRQKYYTFGFDNPTAVQNTARNWNLSVKNQYEAALRYAHYAFGENAQKANLLEVAHAAYMFADQPDKYATYVILAGDLGVTARSLISDAAMKDIMEHPGNWALLTVPD